MTVFLAWAIAAQAAGCGDDTTPTPDSGMDAAGDGAVDGAVDGGGGDAGPCAERGDGGRCARCVQGMLLCDGECVSDCGSCATATGRCEDRCVASCEGCSGACRCPTGQKLCGGRCVRVDDPLFGCGPMACEPCALSNAAAACMANACAVMTCSDGFGNCDGMASNGCEVDVRVSNDHCGACGGQCRPANATGQCRMSACALLTCAEGFGDCDGMVANGCETATSMNPAHCGRCGNACTFANAAATCSGGLCNLGACAEGYGNCDGMAANGCETPTGTSAAHCGRCGNACALDNAMTSCRAGACAVTACLAGFGDCDAMAANGCEADTRASATHCGACGRACMLANATATCAAGECAVARCSMGFGNCDGVATNGCEQDLQTSTANCGACGRMCALPNATAACVAGACAVARCAAGFADCDMDASNGCETDTRASRTHCGTCGNACGAGQFCAGGTCDVSCLVGQVVCSGTCSFTAMDGSNCGACGNRCTFVNATATCASGVCGLDTCVTGFGDCDRVPGNGCEVSLLTSSDHCGACGRACVTPNAAPACTMGTCGVGRCNDGFGDCDGAASNGCERDVRTTPSHCGACGRACALSNAVESCVAGACAVASCLPGFGDCDAMAANGCETDVRATAAHCGMCGRACMLPHATPSCVAGACRVMSCEVGFHDLDGDASNGCEYACTPATGADNPDALAADTDCDGIDGSVARAVFVSPSGDDGNPGTMALPKRTLAAAVATAATGMRDVYADRGTYNESLTLVSGVSVYGGFNAGTPRAGAPRGSWGRAPGEQSSLNGGTVAVRATGLAAPTTLAAFSITAAAGGTAPGGAGEASIGLRVVDSAGFLTVRDCAVVAGRGGNGAPGVAGGDGAVGGNGGSGGIGGSSTATGGCALVSMPLPGTPGASSCMASGGAGGTAIVGMSGGGSGTGGSGTSAGTGGTGGSAVASPSCNATSLAGPGMMGGAGGSGMDGVHGAAGNGAGTVVGGAWVASPGAPGSAGVAGSGGGGGGAGGGQTTAAVGGSRVCCAGWGGAGGGGGAGGCGGAAGGGGGG
ncbi:MAG: hypothetical protein HY909_00710, partial [Deltaproteobacteria bacterium]|nr:hypothetical protein [Deltaproteobacteria bacterium]